MRNYNVLDSVGFRLKPLNTTRPRDPPTAELSPSVSSCVTEMLRARAETDEGSDNRHLERAPFTSRLAPLRHRIADGDAAMDPTLRHLAEGVAWALRVDQIHQFKEGWAPHCLDERRHAAIFHRLTAPLLTAP